MCLRGICSVVRCIPRLNCRFLKGSVSR
uniref:Uncharacterized protein n=1 Tax=Strigamia maritima TaxID=126957 RepID=T1JBL0_STRMM